MRDDDPFFNAIFVVYVLAAIAFLTFVCYVGWRVLQHFGIV